MRERGTGELGVVEDVDGELERLARRVDPDEPVDVLDPWYQRMRVVIRAGRVVLTQEDSTPGRDQQVVRSGCRRSTPVDSIEIES